MRLRQIRKTAFITLILLLTCAMLLLSVSYAWLTISRVPKVVAIDTNLGSNGNLEIALLSDSTFLDPTQIKSSIGSSAVVQDPTLSNQVWGNVVNLSDKHYGLGQIALVPARLNVKKNADGGHAVSSNILVLPNYGFDGRFSGFDSDSVSAVAYDSKFTYLTTHQSYGVRGIGSASSISLQQAALSYARSSVRASASAANRAAIAVWSENGSAFVDILLRRYAQGSNSFSADDISSLRATAVKTLDALKHIDNSLRQSAVGYAASTIRSENTFKSVRAQLENTEQSLSQALSSTPLSLPHSFMEYVALAETDMARMRSVISSCDRLSGNSFSWNQISPMVANLLNADAVYVGDKKLSDLPEDTVLGPYISLTLSSDAGPIARIADFTGSYTAYCDYSGTDNTMISVAAGAEPVYLTSVAEVLDKLWAAAGEFFITQSGLDDPFGYIVDMAFRCNENSDLLLQTSAADRIEDGSGTSQTQGGGSYMRFVSSQLSREQMLSLMGAIRIGFMDSSQQLLGIAKLDTENSKGSGKTVIAPLRLYDFTVTDGGKITMGQQLPTDHPIADLPKNTAVVLSVVVWLDGDHVDNSLAAYSSNSSMNGTLNLQFASSVNLVSSDQPIQKEN